MFIPLVSVIFVIALGMRIHLERMEIALYVLLIILFAVFVSNSALKLLLLMFLSAPVVVHIKPVNRAHILFRFTMCASFLVLLYLNLGGS
jgi:hypothetical protein